MSTEQIERAAELFAPYPPLPFSYDPGSRQFTISEEQVSLQDYAQYNVPSVDPITPEQALRFIEDCPLALNVFDTHYQLPRLYNWIRGFDAPGWKAITEQVTDNMMDAYVELNGDNRRQLQKGSYWGFGVGLVRLGHPVFRVTGDCACYAVTPDGIFDQNFWDDGLAEYAIHNIGWQAQRVALHAGAGALARLCQIDEANG